MVKSLISKGFTVPHRCEKRYKSLFNSVINSQVMNCFSPHPTPHTRSAELTAEAHTLPPPKSFLPQTPSIKGYPADMSDE